MTQTLSDFVRRHIGPTEDEMRQMLSFLGVPSLETLIAKTVPESIRLDKKLAVPKGVGEYEALAELRAKFATTPGATAMIGQGYHGTRTPPVIARNLFENPAWYTSYTPYQAEISQGRLEMLFHFQTLVAELTGLPVANASLLDEATAVAEAVATAVRHHRGRRTIAMTANTLHPQCRSVLQTRCSLAGWTLLEGIDFGQSAEEAAAVIIQVPDTYGEIADVSPIVDWARKNGALVIFSCDPLALTLLPSPAELGADICVGSMQRFGLPMGNGGPHAAYMAVGETLTRLLPGRLIGQSLDAAGNPAYRLALQTREQHIRREKATSNICTAQALLANMAAAYAVWHGPKGLIAIAARVNALASRFAASLKQGGRKIRSEKIFDTVTIETAGETGTLAEAAEQSGYLLRRFDDAIGVAFDETTTEADLLALCRIFGVAAARQAAAPLAKTARGADFLTQPVFHAHRDETSMMRYLRSLADKDLALDRTMIPLGSCTMKLNAAAEMMPVSWREVADVHPFSPPRYLSGYDAIADDLDRWLCSITGFARISFQPNAGSQGEFAGLAAIRRFHEANGGTGRRICLIPSSAHGTNPASAQMAGLEVLVVRCDEQGNVDIADLEEKAAENSERLAALMITYPSTHGVFEPGIARICEIVHRHGGQVYLDGANLNAMVGLARLGDFGADICHMNLHKTFCIPHGGGGPGVGPVGAAAHLVPYLPGNVENATDYAVSAAPLGSASILPITWMYIRMMGAEGLKRASEIAILNANYLAKRLDPHFPVLYSRDGRVAHECIIDTRHVRESGHVDVEDIAKRLIDYGFHAPTMSWPVAGTLMVEPTESEPKSELDRFADAMESIRNEIREIEKGRQPADDNLLVNAPHTAAALLAEEWSHPYSRQTAADPAGRGLGAKYWPPVSRVDNVHGDRHLICTCPPLSDYAEAG